MATKKTSSDKTGSASGAQEKKGKKKPGFFSEASENIEAGARLIGKKASKMASELADTAGKIKEEVKGLESEALVTASGKIH